ncbi:uncharacterized protein KGF55_000507 [Candida pseudojiufengensis]|uniref:uncharacterized protein n=1 Tax=Candida pseudojiufengensis TaxID=497109 RepID=UPI002225079B|nr:uncharacterized protein KGF55_000507 [Candida pseudojiufengensis]KAI5966198.1 hypothetical protein KGF55_000507 [Candida pseudojiufengensis]
MATLRDSTTGIHSKRKLNELEDISNTPNKQQQQEHLLYRNSLSPSKSNIHKRTRYSSDINTNTTTSSQTSTSSIIIERPITRSNSKLLLEQQELQKQQKSEKPNTKRSSSSSRHLKTRSNSDVNSTKSDSYHTKYNKDHLNKQSNYTHKSSNTITPPSPTPSDGLSNDEYSNENNQEIKENHHTNYKNHQDTSSIQLEYENENYDLEQQERPQHRRCKSVSFVLPNEETKTFQHSPLLTPKDEEDEEEITKYLQEKEQQQQQQHHQEEEEQQNIRNNETYPATPPESLNDHHNQSDYMDPNFQNIITLQTSKSKQEINESTQEEILESQLSILQTNPDYIVLNSSLNLSLYQNQKIKNDIIKLSNLKNQIESSTSTSSSTSAFTTTSSSNINLKNFIIDLILNKLNLPKPESIINSPFINWSKYHSSLINLNFNELILKKGGDDNTSKYLNDDEIKLRLFDLIK